MKKTKNSGVAEKHRLALEQRRNKRFKIFAAILLVAIAAESGFIFAKSDTFKIRKIIVTGNERVSEKRILKLSGIDLEKNIFDFSAANTRKNIETEPWIKGATVKRELPLFVAIKVYERSPAAVFQSGAKFFLVDDALTTIELSSKNVFEGMPVVKDIPYEDVTEPGGVFRSAVAANAVRVLKSLDSETAAAIISMSAPTIDGLCFTLNSGILIMYGKAEMVKQKNYAIKVIMSEGTNEGKTWQYIDVRVPSNPAAKAAG